jgi:hypothetical protein
MTEIEVKPEHVADPNTRRVGILVGIVGIFLSVVTIASHRAHTDAVIDRTKSNDQWGYYQAKKIRESSSEIAITVLQALTPDPARIDGAVKKLEGSRDHYLDDAKKAEKEARQLEEETDRDEKRALYFDIGEGLLELGLVLCSLYFMARKGFFPILGLVSAIAGALLGVTGFLL